MIEITDYDSNFIYLKANSASARQLDADYMRSKKLYKIPISLEAIRDLDELTDTTVLNYLKAELSSYVNNVYKLKFKDDTEGDERLRPYQRVDVEFLKQRSAAAVFNEQRTGKTPTTLLAAKGKLGKNIIVCPASLKLNWAQELYRWLGKKALVIRGTKIKRRKLYDLFQELDEATMVISYETLRADVEEVRTLVDYFDVLIADEVHRLRNYKTKQSIALYKVRNRTKHVYALTGTPAMNHPSDVFGILKLLRPKKFTSFWYFVERYFGYEQGPFGREILGIKPHRVDELTEILDMISVQRKRKDVMKWIPKIQDRKIFLDPDTKQKKYIEQILKEFSYGEQEIPNVIAQLTRLRQVSLDPGLLDLDGGSPKTEFLKEYVSDNDEKIIVFSVFTSFLKRLAEVIPNSELLTGEMSEEQKDAAVWNVQHGSSKVLLSNIKVGGVGWTLDNVDTIIFTDKSYNPVDNEQAADRFIPTNPNKAYGAKQIITLLMANTIEQNIESLLRHKTNIIQYVNNYGVNALVNYGKGENNNNAGVSNI